MFCTKCGAEAGPEDRFCRNCGARLLDASSDTSAADNAQHDGFASGEARRDQRSRFEEKASRIDDAFDNFFSSGDPRPEQYRKTGSGVARTESKWWAVLGFFFPLIGLILYLVWYDDRRERANLAGKGALIGVIVNVCFGILATILSIMFTLMIPLFMA